jgi:hypothetical protein
VGLLSLSITPVLAGGLIADRQHSSESQTVCYAQLSFPPAMSDLPLVYDGLCPNGSAEGRQTITFKIDGGESMDVQSTFIDGRTTGYTKVTTTFGFRIEGVILPNNIFIGKFEGPNGARFEGEFRDKSAWQGITTKPGQRPIYRLAGQVVSQDEYHSRLGEVDKAQLELIQAPIQPPQMVKLQLEDRKTCLADLPAKLFKIDGEFGGACKNGYYTGKADLKLTPVAGNTLPKMNVSLRYDAGQVVGPVKVKYPTYNTTYVGTLSDWEPQDGQTAQPIGNDNYAVIVFQDGQQVNQYREYRQPSEETMMLRRLGRDLLYIGVNIAVSCVSGDCPFKREKHPPVYQPTQQSPPPVIASNQNPSQESRPLETAQNQSVTVPSPDAPVEAILTVETQEPVQVAQVDTNQAPSVATKTAAPFGGGTNPPVEAPVIPEPKPC